MTTPVAQPANDTLLEVRNLKKYFPIKGGFLRRTVAEVRAVDDVSFTVKRGETLGLVGESGCGKTTTGRTVLRLERATAGEVIFEGQDVMRASGRTMKALRRDMQIIFQDPYASLDPRITIGESVAEGLVIHGIGTPAERRERVREVLAKVGLSAAHMTRFPHEFSGGQRQRIGIARALIMEPKLIVCDEPVSALDVSIQSQVLNLLRSLQREFGLTYLFIAHNLAVVEHISDRVGVMYLGKLVELTTSTELFREPLHPYTKALISAIPHPNPFVKRERIVLQGDVPSPINPPSGCRFHPRCWIAKSICKEQEPAFEEKRKGHWVACHFAGQF
ncbi:dipeptide ABC transporter ATP-binding protein [Chloroflexus sp.]|uniref:ABC transporter ATP-binding protein n=1 Tax=Chloroflexus sp. TaxID=1904827 RepID=UPI00298EE632|nr:dipeptide ABC transporter ATP-binding protein [Chloroflexus sp.]MCX7859415.1 dipeptide ABC transporter ATP-binding protein [Chloroflexus sp.]MDW8403994.1 dipeptide ABC transporter ATP-binding protein [Chloroflexus sp.]